MPPWFTSYQKVKNDCTQIILDLQNEDIGLNWHRFITLANRMLLDDNKTRNEGTSPFPKYFQPQYMISIY